MWTILFVHEHTACYKLRPAFEYRSLPRVSLKAMPTKSKKSARRQWGSDFLHDASYFTLLGARASRRWTPRKRTQTAAAKLQMQMPCRPRTRDCWPLANDATEGPFPLGRASVLAAEQRHLLVIRQGKTAPNKALAIAVAVALRVVGRLDVFLDEVAALVARPNAHAPAGLVFCGGARGSKQERGGEVHELHD